MLNITVTIENEKVILEGLEGFSEDIRTKAIPAALREIASGTAREAIRFLSGPKRGFKTVKAKGSGRQRAVPQKTELAGGYPVPRLSGNLRRLMRWLGPNRTTESEGLSFTTGPMDAVIFNSAGYASVIHEGMGTSAKYGERRYIDDAFEVFNQGDKAIGLITEKIAEVKSKRGF